MTISQKREYMITAKSDRQIDRSKWLKIVHDLTLIH